MFEHFIKLISSDLKERKADINPLSIIFFQYLPVLTQPNQLKIAAYTIYTFYINDYILLNNCIC